MKIKALLLAFLMFFLPIAAKAYNPLPESAGNLPGAPAISSSYAILFDAVTDTILYEKASGEKIYPASLTKVLTAIVAMEHIEDLTRETTVSAKAVNLPSGSSNMALRKDDTITALDLLYGLMLPSGNDAANALAEMVSGSVEEFVKLMNEKAAALGMTGSHFVNPHGLHDPEHYTTARDYGLLAKAYISHPILITISSTAKYNVTVTRGGQKTQYAISNTNEMLDSGRSNYMEGVKGMKTGYTSPAGNCLATYYEKDGRSLISVVFKAPTGSTFSDSKQLLKYGLDNFTTLNLAEVVAQQKIRLTVENSSQDDEFNGQLDAVFTGSQPVYYTTTTTVAAAILTSTDPVVVEIPAGLVAPIYIADSIGKITFRIGNEVIYTGEAFAGRTVMGQSSTKYNLTPIQNLNKQNPVLKTIKSPIFIGSFIGGILLILLVLFALRVRSDRRKNLSRRKSYIVGRSRYR